jgi:hypothetical protein
MLRALKKKKKKKKKERKIKEKVITIHTMKAHRRSGGKTPLTF